MHNWHMGGVMHLLCFGFAQQAPAFAVGLLGVEGHNLPPVDPRLGLSNVSF